MKTTKMLREMLNSGEPFLTAGANDALSAVIAERAGFKAVTMAAIWQQPLLWLAPTLV